MAVSAALYCRRDSANKGEGGCGDLTALFSFLLLKNFSLSEQACAAHAPSQQRPYSHRKGKKKKHARRTRHSHAMSGLYVIKRDNRKEPCRFDKITARVTKLSYGLNPEFCDPVRFFFRRAARMHFERCARFAFCFAAAPSPWRPGDPHPWLATPGAGSPGQPGTGGGRRVVRRDGARAGGHARQGHSALGAQQSRSMRRQLCVFCAGSCAALQPSAPTPPTPAMRAGRQPSKSGG
jgi:hypothetical protein